MEEKEMKSTGEGMETGSLHCTTSHKAGQVGPETGPGQGNPSPSAIGLGLSNLPPSAIALDGVTVYHLPCSIWFLDAHTGELSRAVVRTTP